MKNAQDTQCGVLFFDIYMRRTTHFASSSTKAKIRRLPKRSSTESLPGGVVNRNRVNAVSAMLTGTVMSAPRAKSKNGIVSFFVLSSLIKTYTHKAAHGIDVSMSFSNKIPMVSPLFFEAFAKAFHAAVDTIGAAGNTNGSAVKHTTMAKIIAFIGRQKLFIVNRCKVTVYFTAFANNEFPFYFALRKLNSSCIIRIIKQLLDNLAVQKITTQ